MTMWKPLMETVNTVTVSMQSGCDKAYQQDSVCFGIFHLSEVTQNQGSNFIRRIFLTSKLCSKQRGTYIYESSNHRPTVTLLLTVTSAASLDSVWSEINVSHIGVYRAGHLLIL